MNANEVMNKLEMAVAGCAVAECERREKLSEQLELIREYSEYVRESTTKRDILRKLAEELTRIAADLDSANNKGDAPDQDARASLSEHWNMCYYNTIAAAAMVSELADEWDKMAVLDVQSEEAFMNEGLRLLKGV